MEFVHSGPFEFFKAVFFLAALAWTAGKLGNRALRFCGVHRFDLNEFESIGFSAGLGFLSFSLLALALGLLGALNTRNVFFLFFGGFIYALNGFSPRVISENLRRASRFVRSENGLVLCLGLVFVLSFVQCSIPPIHNDALAYHLAHSKHFVLSGRVEPLPFSRESLWPYNTEMLFCLGLILQGTILAQMLHWIFFLLTALLIYGFCLRFFDRGVARFAVLVFAFTPAAFAQSSQAYVDLSLAFYIFMSVHFFALKDSIPSVKAAILSGLACGGALGTKYLGIGCFLLLQMLWFFRGHGKWKNALFFFAGSAAVSVIWYARSYWVLGNPVYPFLPRFFGGNGYEFDIGEGVGMGKGPVAAIFFLWNLAMRPWNFGGEMLGPVFVMAGPLVALHARRARPLMKEIAFFVFLYFLFLFRQSQQARFYLTLVPFLSVMTAFVFQESFSGNAFFKKGARIVLACVFVIHAGLFAYRTRDTWGVLSGKMGSEEYLLKHERSYAGFQFLNRNAKPGESVFVNESRHFYSSLANVTFDELALRRKLEQKGTHWVDFILHRRFNYVWLTNAADDECGSRLVASGYRKIFHYDFTESRGQFNEVIYQLNPTKTRILR